MLLQLATWVLVFSSAASLGSGLVWLLRRWTGVRRAFLPDTFGRAWLGFAAAIAFLELFSLFGKIGPACITMLALLCAPGAVPASRWGVRTLRAWLRRSVIGTGLVLVWVLGVTALVCVGANEFVGLGDTCSTHIQQVMWARDHGAVPGLGILNAKLAFDQSAHLFAALLDHGAWRDRSVRVAIPFFLWLLLVQWVVTIARATQTDGDARGKVFCALTLPFVLAKTQSLELPSLSGDLAMACVALATILALLRLPFAEWRGTKLALRRHGYEALVVCAMAALLVTIKLTGAMILFCGVAVLAASALGLGRRWLAAGAAVPAALILGMLARRVILSGWILFPIPFGNLHLPWSVSRDETIEQYRWIRSWARMVGRSPEDVLGKGFFIWFVPWFEEFRKTPEVVLFLLGFGLLTVRWSSTLRRSAPVSPLEVGITSSVALSLVFWFTGAPDLRFGSVFFWMFAAVAAVPILAARYQTSAGPRMLLATFTCSLLFYTTSTWMPKLKSPPDLFHVPEVNAHWPTLPFDIPTLSGPPLRLNVSSSGRAYCGDAPLPCTPFPRSQKQRRPGDLGSGFIP